MELKFLKEHLHDSNRERFLFIAGKLAAYDGLWGGCGVTNQKQAQDYDPEKPQQIYVETIDARNNQWLFYCNADESVEASYLFKMGDDDEQYREDYTMSVDDLLKWARTQPPEVHEYAKFVPLVDPEKN